MVGHRSARVATDSPRHSRGARHRNTCRCRHRGAVRGSAYRREGTRIIIRENGTYECTVSGGCLEPAVADAAARVIATGEARSSPPTISPRRFGLGLGIGCSGAVDIRIERVEDDPVTRAWLDVIERGEAAVLVTPLRGRVGRLLVRATGTTCRSAGGSVRSRQAAAGARSRLDAPRRRTRRGGSPMPKCSRDQRAAGPSRDLRRRSGCRTAGQRSARRSASPSPSSTCGEGLLTDDRFPRAARILAHFSRVRGEGSARATQLRGR